MSQARAPGAALLHPALPSSLLVLLVNDHWLKRTHPGVLSGKLSDFATMLLLPVLLHALFELVAQERRVDSRIIQGRRQQIAIRQQLCIELRDGFVAIEGLLETRIATQRVHEAAAQACEFFRRRARDRHQQQARRRAVADFVHQDFLIRIARRRQKAAQVVTDHEHVLHAKRGQRQQQPPGQDCGAAALHVHGLRQSAAREAGVGDAGSAVVASEPSSITLASPLDWRSVKQRGSLSAPSMTNLP